MKTYKTYQARNAVKAALVTNHIKAQKKLGVSHADAKAEAYRLYNIKAGLPVLRRYFIGQGVPAIAPPKPIVALPKPKGLLPPLPVGKTYALPSLPPLPKIGA